MSNERLQAAATIWVGLYTSPIVYADPGPSDRARVCIDAAWSAVKALESAAPPSPASEGPAVRVEPTDAEWVAAEHEQYFAKGEPWLKVACEHAYRLARERAEREREL